MKKAILSKFVVAAFTLAVIVAASTDAFGAATIVILNNDAAGAGFNDTTPVTPVGNNTGTTLGQQRLNAFQFAANVWGATLNSNVTITIRASWAALPCTATTATLGSAGTVSIFRDFSPNAVPGTWYSAALANALSGQDLNPNSPEINARFNSNLGNTGCLDGTHFYLGLDDNHGADVDLVTVLIHEFAHGLGFQSFTDPTTGAEATGSSGGAFPSIYDRFLLDDSTGKTWAQMSTDTERQASAINTGNLVWNGTQVDTDLRGVLGTPRLRVNAPAGVAGNYTVGTADFGPHVSAGGTTAGVVLAQDPSDASGASTTDGCSPLTNASAISGHIAMIDRGACNFVTKV
ncbi:MAG TPA: hypothetical protein VE713_08405, partial [Pyrinomonadaceae bacterium]|nr:hypothetical protein [Pyrinomonadaceae bacterium]